MTLLAVAAQKTAPNRPVENAQAAHGTAGAAMNCPNCGAPHAPRQQKCSFCDAALLLVSAVGLQLAQGKLVSSKFEEFRKLIREEPHNGSAHYALGMSYLYRGLKTQALEHLTTARDLMPEVPDIRLNLAWLLINDLGQANNPAETLKEALKEAQACLRIDPSFREATAIACLAEAATVAILQKSYVKAIKLASAAIAACPEMEMAYGERAAHNFDSGNLGEAAKDRRRYLDLAPSTEDSIAQRVFLLNELILIGDTDGAIELSKEINLLPATHGLMLSVPLKLRLLQLEATISLISSTDASESTGAIVEWLTHLDATLVNTSAPVLNTGVEWLTHLFATPPTGFDLVRQGVIEISSACKIRGVKRDFVMRCIWKATNMGDKVALRREVNCGYQEQWRNGMPLEQWMALPSAMRRFITVLIIALGGLFIFITLVVLADRFRIFK